MSTGCERTTKTRAAGTANAIAWDPASVTLRPRFTNPGGAMDATPAAAPAARRLVEEAMQAWMDGDDRAFWRLLADDVDYTVSGSTAISGRYAGRADFVERALLPMAARLAAGARPVAYETVAEGDRVVLMWSGVGTMANGAPYENDYCWVLDVRDGAIRRVKAYLDTQLVVALVLAGPRWRTPACLKARVRALGPAARGRSRFGTTAAASPRPAACRGRWQGRTPHR